MALFNLKKLLEDERKELVVIKNHYEVMLREVTSRIKKIDERLEHEFQSNTTNNTKE